MSTETVPLIDFKLFEALAPEYKDTDKGLIKTLAEQAKIQVRQSVYGERTSMARVYLVAHMLNMGERKGRTSSVTSETVGSLSRGYGGGMDSKKDSYDLTSYGIEFKRIRRQLVKTPFFI